MEVELEMIASELLRLIEKIPATFWGVVIGSFFSLGGVVLSNRASDKRLRTQLSHDRDLKNRDRELSLRKDIYLEAADAVSAGMAAIGRFANLEIPDKELGEAYAAKSSAISKIYIIAKQETLTAVSAFRREMNAVHVKLLIKRASLVGQKRQVDLLKEQISMFSKERDRMVDLMKHYNLEGMSDQHRWNVIQKNFQFEQERIIKIMKEHDALNVVHQARQLSYMEECVSESLKLSKLLTPTLIAVRKELDLPIDETVYMQSVEEDVQKQEITLKEFVKNIEDLMKNSN